jgi:hypothetical protein
MTLWKATFLDSVTTLATNAYTPMPKHMHTSTNLIIAATSIFKDKIMVTVAAGKV